MFRGRIIMILGPTNSGKTALLYLMQNNTPYKIINNEIQEPEPTLGVILVDEKVEISKDAEIRMAKVKNDVGGEFRDEWKNLIIDLNPHGIIYMLDGREADRLQNDVHDLFEDVLKVGQNPKYLNKLTAVHIFLNFADKWAENDPVLAVKRKNAVTEYFEEIRYTPAYQQLANLNFMVSLTQLSPRRTTWPEVERALKLFATDLTKKA